jgi:hypothetical protein
MIPSFLLIEYTIYFQDSLKMERAGFFENVHNCPPNYMISHP